MIRLKVCCISSIAEAELAVRYGAGALGLVAAMPSGPGIIEEALIAAIIATVPPGIGTFLLTSAREADTIIKQQRYCGANTLQLTDTLHSEQDYWQLRNALPSVKLVQVIHVTGPTALDDTHQLAPLVDGLLLDSGNPNLAVKQLGGTGRVHDWSISAQIVATVAKPVYLAGGLNADNIQTAVRAVKPFGVDLCSSLRSDDRLDESKLAAFTQTLKQITL